MARNKDNFDQEFDQSSLEITNPLLFKTNFSRKKHTLQYTNQNSSSSAENYFSGISGALEKYAESF